LANSALLVRSEKWGPKATIPILNPEITRLLHEYLLEWDPRGDSPLFPMRMGHRYPLKTKYVSRTIFKEAARRLGYDKVRFHDLRHSRATDLFNAGIDSLYIKSFMRHRSMASTQGYVHITTDSMRTILKQKLPKGIYTQTSMYYPL
jgi:integrase